MARDSIQSGDIHNAGKHDDVLGADILGDVATGQGGHHNFGKADGQSAHRGGADGGAAAAAQRNHAVNPLFPGEAGEHDGRTLGHGGDGFASVASGDQAVEINARRGRDFGPGDIWFQFRFIQYSNINDQHLMPAAADLLGDEGVLLALGVHRAQNRDRGHRPFIFPPPN